MLISAMIKLPSNVIIYIIFAVLTLFMDLESLEPCFIF